VSGGLYASFLSFIEPSDMFGFDRSVAFVLMAVIGGLGTVHGPALGSHSCRAGAAIAARLVPPVVPRLYGLLLIANQSCFEPLGLSGLGLRIGRRLEARLGSRHVVARAWLRPRRKSNGPTHEAARGARS